MQDTCALLKSVFSEVIILKNYSKCSITIHICVLENDGGFKAAAFNAASLALIDAGITLKSMVAAVSAGFLQSAPTLDMAQAEESRHSGRCDFTLACTVTKEKSKIAHMELDSKKLSLDETRALMSTAQQGIDTIHETMREKLLD